MIYELPPLPYGINDLAPVISQETIEYHYGKHEQTYIDNLNKLIEGTPFADKPLEEIIKEADGALFNNASQAWNHIFYFFTFSPNGKKSPQGKLAEAINKKWEISKTSKRNLNKQGTTLFGSGWVWLSKIKTEIWLSVKENNAGTHGQRTCSFVNVRRMGTRLLYRLSQQTSRAIAQPLENRRLVGC